MQSPLLDNEVAMEASRLPAGFLRDPPNRIRDGAARVDQLCFLTTDERMLDCLGVRSMDARR